MSGSASQGGHVVELAMPTLDAVFRALLREVVRDVVREEIAALQRPAPTASVDAPASTSPSPYLSPQEAAVVVGVREKTIRSAVKSGRLRAHRLGRLLRIERADLEEYMKGVAAAGPPVDVDGIALKLLQGRRGRTERGGK